MTLPKERTNSLHNTREFLRKLLSPYNGGFKRIPKEVRREAYYCLKHFPWDMHIEEVAKKCPDVFGITPSQPNGGE